jgi:hypothetical protein
MQPAALLSGFGQALSGMQKSVFSYGFSAAPPTSEPVAGGLSCNDAPDGAQTEEDIMEKSPGKSPGNSPAENPADAGEWNSKTGTRISHAQDGSQLQTVVDEQLFIETAKDDQFAEMPGDPRNKPRQAAPAVDKPAPSGAAASDTEPPEKARETSPPERAPEEPVEGLVLGNSGFPSRGN